MNKNELKIFLSVLLIISFLGIVSAGGTLVAGKIYNADFSQTIPGALVQVSCAHNQGNGSVTTTKNTTSLNDGAYAVTFEKNAMAGCAGGDIVHVRATKSNLYGEKSGIVNANVTEEWDIAIVNVPLVPEFGLIAGALTLIGAVVVFFIVRKD